MRFVLPGALIVALASSASAQNITLPAADKPIDAKPAKVLMIGSAEGNDWEVFGDITAVGFDRAENLYVLDRNNGRVVVFDPRGKHLRTMGRKGSGPGEFQLPNAMAVLGDGTVVISDVSRGFGVFDPNGKFLRQVSLTDRMIFP